MINKKHTLKSVLLLVLTMIWICSMAVSANEASDDNSLASLGIITEGAVVTPEFNYSTIEYEVTVPEGTERLELEPVPSNDAAWIVDITGTELVDGKTTVQITVSAENGDQYTYYLYVTAGDAPIQGTVVTEETEIETEMETEIETETETETEDPRYIKVDRSILEESDNTISSLKAEVISLKSKVNLYTKIMYGLIAVCVILLFIIINLLLKKRDLKSKLSAYQGYGYSMENPANYANGQDYGNAYGDQAYGNYDQQYYGYYDQQPGGTGYTNDPAAGTDYSNMGYQNPAQAPVEMQEPQTGKKPKRVKKQKKVKDDPNTVPKPAKARKQQKPMPEYQEPPQPYEYQQPSGENQNGSVEVNMIDL